MQSAATSNVPVPISNPFLRLPTADVVAERIRREGSVSDQEFDQVYSIHQRWVSSRQWTPVAVAARAARLLTNDGREAVLDVGSGVGKFCIVGALATKALFKGVEQRPHLVSSARAAARRFGTQRAVFFEGDFTMIDFSVFDGFYLFNPFEEQLRNGVVNPIDRTIELSPRLFRHHLQGLMRKLGEARRGARVLTYYGHGGPMAPGYSLVHSEPAGMDTLLLWERD
jgi:SAM-dependent methyltransferase